ncbi:hypothetical protein GIB67_021632 [Kingdonia uniflora]|uniref:Uncharacterized protein n=1 Tax=Kingdonia uniflora TaxID=39325 RepID=A0A7J7KY28_9MAGN|nr:hypothetical protein GIB67_021632 [Kingdonia uniflora]
MDEWKRNHVPAFGNWDYADELPITQYFESARQAGLIRHNHSSTDLQDLYFVGHGDLYNNNSYNLVVCDEHLHKPYIAVAHHVKTKGTEKRYRHYKEPKKQGRVCDVTRNVHQQLPLPTKASKPVDEDLYKIPAELLYTKPKRILNVERLCYEVVFCSKEKEGVSSRLIFRTAARTVWVPVLRTMPKVELCGDAILNCFPKEKLAAKRDMNLPNEVPGEMVRSSGVNHWGDSGEVLGGVGYTDTKTSSLLGLANGFPFYEVGFWFALFVDSPEESSVYGVESSTNLTGEGGSGHEKNGDCRVNSFNGGDSTGLRKEFCFPTLYTVLLDRVPGFLIEKRSKTIQARRFMGAHGKESFFDLIHSGVFRELGVIIFGDKLFHDVKVFKLYGKVRGGEELRVEIDEGTADVFALLSPSSVWSTNFLDSILPSVGDSGQMEKKIVAIAFVKPGFPGFVSPQRFLVVHDGIKLLLELMLVIRVLVRRRLFLDI